MTPTTTSEQSIHTDRLERIATLRAKNIRYDNLGESANFSEAEECKNRILDLLRNFVLLMQTSHHAPEQIACKVGAQQVDEFIDDVRDKMDSLPDIATQPFSNNFGVRREQFILNFKKQADLVESRLQIHTVDLRISQLSNLNPTITSDLADMSRLVQKVKSKAEAAIASISDLAAQTAASKSNAVFSQLSTGHQRHETFWAIFSIFFAFLSIASIVYFLFCPLSRPASHPPSTAIASPPSNLTTPNQSVPPVSPYDWFNFIVHRAVLLSAPLVFLRIGLQRYSVERHMRTTYDHRKTIMEQYKTIEELLTSDQDSKAEFRMEIARTILTTPPTGYLSNGRSTGEVTISPVFDMAEKAVRGVNAT